MLALGLLLLGVAYNGRDSYAHDLPRALDAPLGALSALGWSAGFPTLLILLPLVFPDGHLISRRWRKVIWLTAGTIVFTFITSVVDPALWGGDSTTSNVMSFLNGPGSGVVMLGLMVAAAVSWSSVTAARELGAAPPTEVVCRGRVVGSPHSDSLPGQ